MVQSNEHQVYFELQRFSNDAIMSTEPYRQFPDSTDNAPLGNGANSVSISSTRKVGRIVLAVGIIYFSGFVPAVIQYYLRVWGLLRLHGFGAGVIHSPWQVDPFYPELYGDVYDKFTRHLLNHHAHIGSLWITCVVFQVLLGLKRDKSMAERRIHRVLGYVTIITSIFMAASGMFIESRNLPPDLFGPVSLGHIIVGAFSIFWAIVAIYYARHRALTRDQHVVSILVMISSVLDPGLTRLVAYVLEATFFPCSLRYFGGYESICSLMNITALWLCRRSYSCSENEYHGLRPRTMLNIGIAFWFCYLFFDIWKGQYYDNYFKCVA